MASQRKNPTMSKVAPDPGPLPGIDNLPNPIGVNMKAVEDAEAMPGHAALGVPPVSGATNDGDQKDVPTPSFADGKDGRSFPKMGGSNPWPAKPGC